MVPSRNKLSRLSYPEKVSIQEEIGRRGEGSVRRREEGRLWKYGTITEERKEKREGGGKRSIT